jgi:hypothetical protein
MELSGKAVNADGFVVGALLEDGTVEDLGQGKIEVDSHEVFIDDDFAPLFAVAPRLDVIGITGVDGALLVDAVVDTAPVGSHHHREIGGELKTFGRSAVVDVGAEIEVKVGALFSQLTCHVTDHVMIDAVGDVDMGGKGVKFTVLALVVEFGALLTFTPAETVIGGETHRFEFRIFPDVLDIGLEFGPNRAR